MKISRIACTLLALSVVSSAASAQEQKKSAADRADNTGAARERMRDARPEMARLMAQRNPLMMALDVDKDGTLSAAELENAATVLLKLDRNGDGMLSADELRPDYGAMVLDGQTRDARPRDGQPGERRGAAAGSDRSPEMMARMFEQRDRNGDGKLSGEEIPPWMKENLARIDEDGDGSINKSELQKAMTRMAERMDQAGRERGNQKGTQRAADGSGVRPKRPATEE